MLTKKPRSRKNPFYNPAALGLNDRVEPYLDALLAGRVQREALAGAGGRHPPYRAVRMEGPPRRPQRGGPDPPGGGASGEHREEHRHQPVHQSLARQPVDAPVSQSVSQSASQSVSRDSSNEKRGGQPFRLEHERARRRQKNGTLVGVVYRARGPALGSWEDQAPASLLAALREGAGTQSCTLQQVLNATRQDVS
eukprot:95770-Pyramimonas_sp.AAC.2